ncbi:MAG: hypothetical protein P8X57_02430 [Cyclobacteriaceae bacterium]
MQKEGTLKKTAFVITLLLVAAAAAYLLFDKYYRTEPTSLWQLVPSNAIYVFESSRLTNTWDQLHESVMWPSLSSMDGIARLDERLNLIDTLSGEPGGMEKLLGSSFLISSHVVKKNAFDFLFLVDLDRIESQQVISELIEKYESDSATMVRDRTYQEMKINEIENSDWIFSYLVYDNKFIGSFTPFLVEDVIRLIANPEIPGFASVNENLMPMPKLSNDDGNIYVNMDNLGEFMAAFAAPDHVGSAREISQFAENAFLDFKIGSNTAYLSGFTYSGNNTKFLSTFTDQVPVNVDFKFRVPVNTAVFYHFTFSDVVAWHNRATKFWEVNDRSYMDERAEMFELYSFDIDAFYQGLGSSVSLIELEIPGRTDFTPLVMADTRDANGIMNTLNRMGESIARAAGDTTYIERYGNFEIRELEIAEFPRHLFGPVFSGFERTYFAFDNNMLYLSPDLVTLKETLSAISSENTWGRSVLYNKFIDDLLDEANYTVVINNRKSWENALSMSDPVWKEFAQKNEGAIKNFGLLGIQFSKMDEFYYTSISLLHDGKPIQVARQPSADIRYQASLTYPASTKPFVVRNHINNQLETVLQDSANYFHLIGSDGTILWSKLLDGKIQSEVEQVDFYQNNKLQYFFTTDSAIHIIDRLGNYVEGYPVPLKHRARYARVVDYDNSRRYRWLISDEFGNLYLYNKNGVVLEGWTPRATGGRLSSTPFHIRVRGRDCLVAIEASGKVHMMNRRGEYYPNFPLDLGVRVETVPYIKPGANFKETNLTVINKDGKLVTFNMEGEIVRSEQLYKPTTDTEFRMVPDLLSKTYVIARYDRQRLVIMDRDQNEIMAKDYLKGNTLNVQYYDFGSDVQVYTVADPAQSFTYLYDNEGNMIGSRPLNSGMEIALLYSELNKTFTIYYVSGKKLIVQVF